MIDIEQLGPGIWHVKKFFPDDVWHRIQSAILKLDNANYTERFEPMRYRSSSYSNQDLTHQLTEYSNSIRPAISELTQNVKLRFNVTPTLWRDQEGYCCALHPDDYTRNPTAQIYVDGDQDQGTSFQIDGKLVCLPFVPNSGYLMDNAVQPIHGMLSAVGKRVRQSIYLIY
jgi:hypothetical protein